MKSLLLLFTLLAQSAQAAPLTNAQTYGAQHTDAFRNGYPGMIMVKGTTDNNSYMLEADPTTGALPVSISGSVPVTFPYDTNYGTVGSNTLRTAAQIGNATGASDFGAGTTSAQTLRVVLPTDQTAIPVSFGSEVLTGSLASPATGDIIVSTDVTNYTHFSLQLYGTWSGNVQVQVSDDNTNWTPTLLSQSGNPASTPQATVSVNNVYVGDFEGKYVRVEATSNNSGTIQANFFLMDGPSNDQNGRYVGLLTGSNVIGAVTQSGTWTVQPGNTANTTPWLVNQNGRNYATSVRYAYSSGAVDTTSWTEVIASTAAVINWLTIFDSSGQTLELGTGGSGSETRVMIIPPGGVTNVPLKIAAGTRVSLRALSATTGAIGEFDLTGLQ